MTAFRQPRGRTLNVMTSYVFDQQWSGELVRLKSLEDTFHGNTTRVLSERGIAAGWRCLEIGAGAGAVAAWMAARGADVLATDLDTRHLTGDGYEVRRHDIVTDPLDDDAFDLAHARAVLEHLPNRADTIARIARAVRPGGWVVIEDVTFEGASADLMVAASSPDLAASYRRMLDHVATVFRRSGADPAWARQLPAHLEATGLVDVGAQVHAPIVRDGNGWTLLTLDQLRAPIVAMGLATAEEVEEAHRALGAGFAATPLMVSAWGRRPA